jgi:hypothetical protein
MLCLEINLMSLASIFYYFTGVSYLFYLYPNWMKTRYQVSGFSLLTALKFPFVSFEELLKSN